MTSETDFMSFYDNRLRPLIGPVEALREDTLSSFKLITIATAIATTVWVGIVWYVVEVFHVPDVAMSSFVIPLGVGAWKWGAIWDKYRKQYQLKLIAPIMRLYGFSYDPDRHISEEQFTACGLFQPGGAIEGSDLVTGVIGSTPFKFSDLEVTLYKRKSRDRTYFSGVFFIADFNKNISGTTYVSSRHDFLHRKQAYEAVSGEVVKLEDPEFESAFATSSTNQIEARYILSPTLMRRILAFSQLLKAPVAIAFTGSSMYIAMYSTSTRLEPKLRESVLRPALFLGVWSNIEFLSGIVDEMNLNTRIWTKGDKPPSADPVKRQKEPPTGFQIMDAAAERIEDRDPT